MSMDVRFLAYFLSCGIMDHYYKGFNFFAVEISIHIGCVMRTLQSYLNKGFFFDLVLSFSKQTFADEKIGH